MKTRRNGRRHRTAQRGSNPTPENPTRSVGPPSSVDRSGSKHCQQCGRCCGLIFVSQSEVEAIELYILKHGIVPNDEHTIECPFLAGEDGDEKRQCLIYPVRPGICRAFPHSSSMQCPNGACAKLPDDKVRKLALGGGPPVTTLNDRYGATEILGEGFIGELGLFDEQRSEKTSGRKDRK